MLPQQNGPPMKMRLVQVNDMQSVQLGHARHHCTDVVCVFILSLGLLGLGLILRYANEHGDMRRLYHGLNFKGELCGIDVPESYLYWCQSGDNGLLDLSHPTCVNSCPTAKGTSRSCYNATLGSFAWVADYPTYPFAGRLCMPVDSWLTSQVSHTPLAHDLLAISQISRAWQPLLVSAGLALVLGYAYLFFLNFAVGQIVWVCMAIMVLVSVLGGSYLIYASWPHGLDGKPDTGDETWDICIGASSIVLGLAFLLIASCRKRSIDMAIGCIEAACECIFDLPSLLFEPLVILTLKAASLGPMIAGFLWLLSCGKVVDKGMYRILEYSDKEKAFILYYLFMLIWINELLSAVSHFVLAYVTTRWYFAPYGRACVGKGKWGLPAFAVVQGFSVGFFYHLGTLSFGALVITFVRAFRMCLAYLEKVASDNGNCLGRCLAKVLFCCLTCFESCLEFLNNYAYMDVALNSSTFCDAARRATAVITNEISTLGALTGACWMFQLGGLGAITGLGSLLTGLMVRHVSVYNDPTSEFYVQDPVSLTIVAGFISLLVAATFMIGFDTISCTILYCFAIEKHHTRTFAGKPQSRTIMDAGGKPCTRYLLRLATFDHGSSRDNGFPESVRRECTPSTLQHLLQDR